MTPPKKIYVCSPLRGNYDLNLAYARKCCRYVVAQSCIPIAPHLYFPQFLDDADPEQRALGIAFALALLDECDEIWVFGMGRSEGMVAEIAHAREMGIRVQFVTYPREMRRGSAC